MNSNVMTRRTIVSSYHLTRTSVEELLMSCDYLHIIDALFHRGRSQTDLEACRMLIKIGTQDHHAVVHIRTGVDAFLLVKYFGIETIQIFNNRSLKLLGDFKHSELYEVLWAQL